MGTVYKVRGNDQDGWYWHLSRIGRPGLQSDTYPTRREAVEAVLEEFPEAKEA